MNLLEAMDDPNLFGRQFAGAELGAMARLHRDAVRPAGPSGPARARPRVHRLSEAPSSPVREAWVVAGRRAGKIRIFALIAVYLAHLPRLVELLAPGERGYVLIIAAERQQTEAIMGFIRALLKGTPLLAPLIAFEGSTRSR